MQEQEAVIEVYNEKGEVIVSKPRKDVNKKIDILKSVVILVVNGKKELFMIKARDSLWADKWGGSCAGLVRHDEDVREAAKRTLQRELGINDNLNFLGEQYHDWDGVKRLLNVFSARVNDNKPNPNKNDIKEWRWVSFDEAQAMIKRNECMPSINAAFGML